MPRLFKHPPIIRPQATRMDGKTINGILSAGVAEGRAEDHRRIVQRQRADMQREAFSAEEPTILKGSV